MSEPSISETDGADTDGRVEQRTAFAQTNLRRAPRRRRKRAVIRSRQLRDRRGTYRGECSRDWNHSSWTCFAEDIRDQARRRSETDPRFARRPVRSAEVKETSLGAIQHD